MEKTEKEPRGFYVEKGSFFVHAAVTVLALSMAARLLGTMNLWGDPSRMITQILLPIGCSLLYILLILLLGRIALWPTILPVLGGAAFFILSRFDTPSWPLFICIALAFLAAFLYTATLAGLIRSKWLLVLAFALIFAYQIVFCAVPVFGDQKTPVSFADGMTLLSALGMIFAMLLATLAFRRKKAVKPAPDLPPIKDPIVLPPESGPVPAEAESVPAAGAEESGPAPAAASETPADLPSVSDGSPAPEEPAAPAPEETKQE